MTADLLHDPAPLRELGEHLVNAERIVVAAHARPDGDAIGSSVGLGACLAALGKKVAVLNADPVPEILKGIPGWEMVISPDQLDFEPEIFVALDTATEARLGDSVVAVGRQAPLWITLDHHISNELYGDLIHVAPSAPATGEIVFDLLETAGIPLVDIARDQLFAALSSDTGSFRFPATTARTLRIAADLVEGGVRPGQMAEALYASFPGRRLALTQALFETLETAGHGRIASWGLSREAADQLGMMRGDLEGLVDTLRSVREVEIAVQMEEQTDGSVRLSARSREGGVDVSRICGEFGGGGHRNAAGASLRGPINEARERFVETAMRHLPTPD